jgi:hypothetical protein
MTEPTVPQLKNQIARLQRELGVRDMLLAAFTGTLQTPAGVDPFDGTPDQFEAGRERLRVAYCIQQPAPIPDQMALVWRADVMRLANSYTHKNAFFETHRASNLASSAVIGAEAATLMVSRLVKEAAWFECMPLLDDQYEFTVRYDRAELLKELTC